MQDSYRHKGLRRKLVEGIKAKGIIHEKVLAAMRALPRHYFLDNAFEEHAYEDKPFPIGNGQTISQPYTVAYQTQMLDPQPKDKVLEIGTGSGYQAAILALMGARVFTLERQEDLFLKTRELLDRMDLGHVRMFFRDGYGGLPELAPFDRIIVTAGAKEIPQPLFDQLKVGGRLVIPHGAESQRMLCITKDSAGKPGILEEGRNFRFVPFLEGLVEREE